MAAIGFATRCSGSPGHSAASPPATPWLALTDPESRNVAAQRGDPGSLLSLYRELIALRRELDGALEPIAAAPGVIAYRRGEHAIAINLGDRPAAAPVDGRVVLSSAPREPGLKLEPDEGRVLIAR